MVTYFAHRVASIRQRLKKEQLDAFIVSSATNRRYLTGFTGSAGTAVVTEKSAFLLTDFRYVEQGAKQAPSWTIVKQERDGIEQLKETLAGENVRRIGYEASHTTVRAWERLKDAVADVEWVATDGWVEEVRSVKDDSELAIMEQAVALADRTFDFIIPRLKGRSEKDVAFDIEMFMRREGGDGHAFSSIVASGPNGALPHAVPTDRIIGQGDMVTLDFGAIVDGYCSDVTRTVVIGEPTQRQREMYELVAEAQRVGLAHVRPGVTGAEVDGKARQVIEDAGLGEAFGHSLGHGIGMDVHESPPTLSVRGSTALQVGMVTSVEPGVYIPGWGGIRIEDLVVVVEGGCRILTQSTKDLLEI